MDLILCVAVGLAGGVCIGYVLGRESPRRCAECLSNDANRWKTGYRAGWAECASVLVGYLKEKAVEAKNTWTITKDELNRIEEDVQEIGRE